MLGACAKRLVYIRFRTSRSKATLAETYEEFLEVPATADGYAGQPCPNFQHDLIHLLRKAEYGAFGAYYRLEAGGRIGADGVLAMMLEAWKWARSSVARIMEEPGSCAVPVFGDDGGSGRRPVPAPDAPTVVRLPDGSGRRRSPGDVRAADAIPDDGEAADMLGAIKAHFRLHYLYLFVRRWDTASDEAAAALRALVYAEILPLYGEGKHPARTAISNALDDMFYALSVPGMPFDSNGIERVFNWPLGPFKRARFQVQSVWGMTTAEESLTFDGMCEINGTGPADAPDMLAFDPDGFAADIGAAAAAAAAAVAAHRNRTDKSCIVGRMRQVRRYRPTGPCPPPQLMRPPPTAPQRPP